MRSAWIIGAEGEKPRLISAYVHGKAAADTLQERTD